MLCGWVGVADGQSHGNNATRRPHPVGRVGGCGVRAGEGDGLGARVGGGGGGGSTLTRGTPGQSASPPAGSGIGTAWGALTNAPIQTFTRNHSALRRWVPQPEPSMCVPRRMGDGTQVVHIDRGTGSTFIMWIRGSTTSLPGWTDKLKAPLAHVSHMTVDDPGVYSSTVCHTVTN